MPTTTLLIDIERRECHGMTCEFFINHVIFLTIVFSHSLVYGEAARDLARHFVQRWNATKTEKLKDNDEYPYLLPKSYDSIKIPRVFVNKDTHKADVQVLR